MLNRSQNNTRKLQVQFVFNSKLNSFKLRFIVRNWGKLFLFPSICVGDFQTPQQKPRLSLIILNSLQRHDFTDILFGRRTLRSSTRNQNARPYLEKLESQLKGGGFLPLRQTRRRRVFLQETLLEGLLQSVHVYELILVILFLK